MILAIHIHIHDSLEAWLCHALNYGAVISIGNYHQSKMKNVCDDQTIEQLYKKHSPKLRNYLYYKCKDLERANDLVQEAFTKLWEKCKDVIPKTAKSFLYTVARNAMINLINKDKVRMKFNSTQKQGKEFKTPHFDMEYKEYKSKLEGVISDLPDGQREAFLMNRIDKLTYKEIAERLDISVKAVEKRMHKALAKLRDQLTQTADKI